jgi:N6-adenosine-specific RNA methylase IME4
MKLVKYDAASRALAIATRIDEVKDIRDKSIAMAAYAKQAKDGKLIANATALRKRAERRLGELMEENRKAGKLAKGTRGQGRPGLGGSRKDPPKSTPTLASQGVDKHLADRARKAAALSEAQFEQQVARAVKVAVAATEGDAAVVKEARKSQQDMKRRRRAERERLLAGKIVALPDKRYGVIVADPEWKDTVWSEETGMDRHAGNHYPTSDAAVIASRNVASISAKDCVLWIWTTNQHLRIALGVMEAWGFEYKSNYCWGKDKFSTGRWNRSKHELLLIGTQGKVPCPAPGTQWESLVMAPRGKHSAKPECFLEMIETYYPNVPKIELNRRGPPRPGWDAWGNEAEAAA